MKRCLMFLFVMVCLSIIVGGAFAQGIPLADEAIGAAVLGERNPFAPQIPSKPQPAVSVPEKQVVPPKQENVRQVPIQPLRPPVKPGSPIEEKKPEAKPLDLKITGLIWNTNRPQAIINDHVVDVGDKVGEEAIIVAINKTGVEVSYNGQTSTIMP
jgi:hypothetical protein